MNRLIVTLHQHLHDGGGGSKIAVDLKGRVGVEHVGQGALGELAAQQMMRAVSIEQSRP